MARTYGYERSPPTGIDLHQYLATSPTNVLYGKIGPPARLGQGTGPHFVGFVSAALAAAALLASEEPMLVLTLLARELRRAWTVWEWSRRGMPPEQIARNLRVPPRVAETIVARTRGAAGARLPSQLERCWAVERRLKSGGVARAELAALVAELCAGA